MMQCGVRNPKQLNIGLRDYLIPSVDRLSDEKSPDEKDNRQMTRANEGKQDVRRMYSRMK
jgi:hypothetical protein